MTKKKIRKKKRIINKKRFMVSISVILIIILLVILAVYNIVNYDIYKKVISQGDSNSISIEYNKNSIVLWNKIIDYIKEKEKVLTFVRNNYSIEYDNTTKIPKKIEFKTSISNKKIKIEDKEIETININLSNNEHIDKIKSIKLSQKLDKLSSNVFDIYYKSDKEYKLYRGAVEKNKEGCVVIPIDKNINQYFLTYIGLQEIKTENENIEINKKQNAKINLELFPSNATNKQIYYEYDSNCLEISDDGVITPKVAGEYKIKIKVKNELVEKDINLKVDEVVEEIIVDKKALSMETGDTSKIKVTLNPKDAVNNQLKWESDNEGIASVDKDGNITAKNIGKCKITVSTIQEPIISVSINVTVKQKFIANVPETPSSSEIKYVGGVIIVNKKYGLPKDYNPGVNQTALSAFNQMKAEAAKSGFNLRIISGFRSYNTQASLYNNYVKLYGKTSADTFSAKPGNSEHQTGLAFDISSLETSYGNTPEGKWLANNCHRFGFIIRYPKGKQAITGYVYEPWHIRYLGNPIATNVYNSGLCLEEYLKIQ